MNRPDGSHLPPFVALPSSIAGLNEWPELEQASGQTLSDLPVRDRQWLSIATWHRSALYENSGEFPGVSAVCLSLLESVGSAAIDVELRRAIARAAPNFDVKRRDEEANRVGRVVRELLARTLQVQDRARLGRGEAVQAADKVATGSTVRTFVTVALQVAGWWSLAVRGAGLRPFVESLYAEAASSSAMAADVRMLFQQHAQGLNPVFDFVQSGPDHDAVFTVTVTTKDGRSGRAEASSKKQAQRMACHDYLSRHAPHVLADHGPTAKLAPQLARRSAQPLVDHRHAALAQRFACRNPGPFARALIHRSWVYENIRGGDLNRESNALLANLGSSVLIAAVMRRRAAVLLGQSTDPDPDVAIALNIPDAALRPVFEALGLGGLARVTAGLSGKPLPNEIVANMVQAVLAASHIQWPDHAAFEEHLPEEVVGFLTSQATRSLVDPFTRLQELAAELGFSVSEESGRDGPDHNTTFRVRLDVRAPALLATVEGAAPSRTSARKAAAAALLTNAQILTDDSGEVADETIARELLVRQLNVLPASRSRWPRWQRVGRLGAQLLQSRDHEAFGRWAARAQAVLGPNWRPDPVVGASLADYFGQITQAQHRRVLFTATLAQATDSITRAATSDEPLTSRDLRPEDLVALSAAQSAWMSSGAEQAVGQVIENWVLLNRRRLTVDCDLQLDGAAIDGRTAAALLKGLQECAADVSRLEPPRLSVRGRATADAAVVTVSSVGHPLGRQGGSLTMRLLGEAAGRLSVDAPDAESVQFTMQTAGRRPAEDWLLALAFGESPADDYDAELARLLHDLKNEVTAARVASERAAGTRTERLEAELASSRHMDSAAALAVRLRDADMLYSAADLIGSTDLAAFMQAYVSDLIRRLPTHLRVVPPTPTAGAVAVAVAVDERALRAVLDNLVKNAEQAMIAGGEITFEYTASSADEVVLLELGDTGPGIPSEVVEALAAGKPTASSKRDGSGLGLLGVQRILRRAGGDLEAVPRSRGTGWLLTLPLSTSGLIARDVSA